MRWSIALPTAETLRHAAEIVCPVIIMRTPNICRKVILHLSHGVAKDRQPVRINPMGVILHKRMVVSPVAFIGNRPNDDTGMIPVSFHHFS